MRACGPPPHHGTAAAHLISRVLGGAGGEACQVIDRLQSRAHARVGRLLQGLGSVPGGGRGVRCELSSALHGALDARQVAAAVAILPQRARVGWCLNAMCARGTKSYTLTSVAPTKRASRHARPRVVNALSERTLCSAPFARLSTLLEFRMQHVSSPRSSRSRSRLSALSAAPCALRWAAATASTPLNCAERGGVRG